jgi:hypothetical protein
MILGKNLGNTTFKNYIDEKNYTCIVFQWYELEAAIGSTPTT